MMEQIGHMPMEAYVNPAQARATGAGYANPNRMVEDRLDQVEQRPMDRFIPSEQEEAYGLYSRESLLQNGLRAGESVNGPGKDELSDRLTAEEKREDPRELDEGDKELIKRLEARDREVKSHETAHAAAAGEYAEGAPSYTYQMGPDGKMYAIGGSLAVDVGKEATPAENIRKARMLVGSALGVADPSAADAMVAMQASQLMSEGIQIQA
jgi:hypothetical protein